jgi:hypothetical protein
MCWPNACSYRCSHCSRRAIPADRLHFIMFDRDPASSLASWLEKWSDRIPESRLIHNYVIATLNTLRVESYARRHGISSHTLRL